MNKNDESNMTTREGYLLMAIDSGINSEERFSGVMSVFSPIDEKLEIISNLTGHVENETPPVPEGTMLLMSSEITVRGLTDIEGFYPIRINCLNDRVTLTVFNSSRKKIIGRASGILKIALSYPEHVEQIPNFGTEDTGMIEIIKFPLPEDIEKIRSRFPSELVSKLLSR